LQLIGFSFTGAKVQIILRKAKNRREENNKKETLLSYDEINVKSSEAIVTLIYFIC